MNALEASNENEASLPRRLVPILDIVERMHDLKEIRSKALGLMDELGEKHVGGSLRAHGWSLKFDRAKRRLGICKWQRGDKKVKVISLSTHYARESGWEIMEDVVRHEIAHALDFEARGKSDHGPRWRELARSVGADPTRLYEGSDLASPPSKYTGVCPECGEEQPFYRRVKRAYACPICCRKHNRGRYADRFRLRMIERATGRDVTPRKPTERTPGRDAAPPMWKKYTAYCPSCGRHKNFARKPKYEYACKVCCDVHAGGAYDPRFEWVLRQNY